MAIRISGTNGIDMGNTSVSNVDVGVLPYNATTKEYVDTKVNEVVGQLNTDYYQGPYGISCDYKVEA